MYVYCLDPKTDEFAINIFRNYGNAVIIAGP